MSTTQVRGDTTRTGLVIEHLERITDSVNGYPRFRVHFTDGTAARTMSAWTGGYCIDNPEYRGVPLTVTFTAHGKIRSAAPEPEPEHTWHGNCAIGTSCHPSL